MLLRALLLSAALCAALVLAACAGAKPPPIDEERVDLEPPTFSDPTSITNRLFPAGSVAQVVHLGVDRGLPLRIEVTPMRETRVIEWDGREVETVVLQFIAYRDGRILEVAYDHFAQADDGSVWYFGEDVDNYSAGVVADHSGSWLAGTDGPAGMIMPSDPKVGDVFHPENIPGLVFEVVTVRSSSETADGPTGPIEGVLRVEEGLMGGTTEHKLYAPDYGEFRTQAEDELVEVALAVPTDAADGAVPRDLVELDTRARATFDAALAEDWPAVDRLRDGLHGLWSSLDGDAVPPLLRRQMADALEALSAAVDATHSEAASQAAIDVVQAALDLELQHRAAVALVDIGRMGAWSRRAVVDAVHGDGDGLLSSVAILETIWARADSALEPAAAAAIGADLEILRRVTDAGDLDAAADTASRLVDSLAAAEAGLGGSVGRGPTTSASAEPTSDDSEVVVLVGAGDIAGCSSSGDEATAALLDEIEGTVFTLGDNVYNSGTATEFAECYEPSWGRHRARTRPAVGNHEYQTEGARGYLDYFGIDGPTYYAWDAGTWRIYVVDSNCAEVGGCGPGSPQYEWLAADLAGEQRRCVAAMWHHPKFTIGPHDSDERGSGVLWELLDAHGAELILNGHDHNYQRWAPMRPDGIPTESC